MKRLLILFSLLILSIAVSVSLIFPASADEGAEDGGADNAVWEITHADGSVTYAYSFSEAFKKIYGISPLDVKKKWGLPK